MPVLILSSILPKVAPYRAPDPVSLAPSKATDQGVGRAGFSLRGRVQYCARIAAAVFTSFLFVPLAAQTAGLISSTRIQRL
jgi:hypothetical protein